MLLLVLSCAFVYKMRDEGNFSYLRSSHPSEMAAKKKSRTSFICGGMHLIKQS